MSTRAVKTAKRLNINTTITINANTIIEYSDNLSAYECLKSEKDKIELINTKFADNDSQKTAENTGTYSPCQHAIIIFLSLLFRTFE